MNEEIIEHIEEVVEDLPDEVRDFIFGKEYEVIIAELQVIVTDTQQALVLENNISKCLFGVMKFPELKQYIEALPLTDEQKLTVKTIIQEKIVNKLLSLMVEQQEVDMESIVPEQAVPAPTTTTDAPNPSQVLETMRSRLTEAKAIAPSTRDYSVNPKNAPIVDPYREIPEK